MKSKYIAALLAGLSLSACATVPADNAAAPVAVQILAINDFHGNLETPQRRETYLDDAGVQREERLGGAAALAGTLERLRVANSLTVAAGDLIGASPLVSALFLDEPAIQVLSEMGLDVASVGNHEFDRGTSELLRIANGGCEQFTRRDPCGLERYDGAGFDYLAANVVAEGGTTLLPATAMREVDGVRIGFVGLTLEGTPDLVAGSATEGYTFLDEAQTANSHAAELRTQGADAVVLLIHQGADMAPEFTTTGCPLAGGELVGIVERLSPDIGLVVSGHTHDAYTCRMRNSGGGEVLVTSGGRYGGFVTDIAITVDPVDDRVTSATARNVPVQPAMGEYAPVAAIVRRYVEAAGPVADRPVGTITGTPVEDEDCGDKPAQDFVADAYLYAANAALDDTVDLAFVNSGGVRTDLAGADDGVLTYGELAAMAPFGNGLIVLEMTGEQVLALLQQQVCEEGRAATVCDSVLIPSANASYVLNLSQPVGNNIDGFIFNGAPLDPRRTYRVATNSFLVGGGDGFTILSQVPQVANVGFDIDAIDSYVATGDITVPTCGRVRGVAAID